MKVVVVIINTNVYLRLSQSVIASWVNKLFDLELG